MVLASTLSACHSSIIPTHARPSIHPEQYCSSHEAEWEGHLPNIERNPLSFHRPPAASDLSPEMGADVAQLDRVPPKTWRVLQEFMKHRYLSIQGLKGLRTKAAKVRRGLIKPQERRGRPSAYNLGSMKTGHGMEEKGVSLKLELRWQQALFRKREDVVTWYMPWVNNASVMANTHLQEWRDLLRALQPCRSLLCGPPT